MAGKRSTGDDERWLIAREVSRLLGEARGFTLAARDTDDRLSDSALDAGQARADEAERLMAQLGSREEEAPAAERPEPIA